MNAKNGRTRTRSLKRHVISRGPNFVAVVVVVVVVVRGADQKKKVVCIVLWLAW